MNISEYRFCGLNLWTYSGKRSIAWLGGKSSHYSEKKRYLKFEAGDWGYLGVEITVGGEEKEIMMRLGIGFSTLYIALTGVVPDAYEKAKKITIEHGGYAYELDYSNEGRETGAMLNFRRTLWVRLSLWNSADRWTRRSITEKFRRFPFCEGIARTFYIVN